MTAIASIAAAITTASSAVQLERAAEVDRRIHGESLTHARFESVDMAVVTDRALRFTRLRTDLVSAAQFADIEEGVLAQAHAAFARIASMTVDLYGDLGLQETSDQTFDLNRALLEQQRARLEMVSREDLALAAVGSGANYDRSRSTSVFVVVDALAVLLLAWSRLIRRSYQTRLVLVAAAVLGVGVIGAVLATLLPLGR